VLDHLRRGTHRDHVTCIEPGDAGFRLEVRVVDELGLVALFDDGVRARERCVDVALVKLPAREQVAFVVNERRAFLQRGGRIRDDRQLLVVDVDQLDGRERGVLVLGRDDRDRLAVIANDAVREHVRPRFQRADLERLAGNVDPDRVLGHVLRGQDRGDARYSFSGRRVDAEQPRVRDVGAFQHGVQHPGQREVRRVARAPGDLFYRVVADERASDRGAVCPRQRTGGGGLGEPGGSPSGSHSLGHAEASWSRYASTASTIFV
jgi:hypothetical protein